MKKLLVLFSVLILANFCSCGLIGGNTKTPEAVDIDGVEWSLAYENGYFYPQEDLNEENKAGSVEGYNFYNFEGKEFDFIVCYSRNGKPNIYFKTEELDSARAYYDNPENCNYYCIIGNIHDENDHRVYELTDLDTDKFEELYSFSMEESYDPSKGLEDRVGKKEIPFDPNSSFTDGEIVFYKADKSGVLCTSKGANYRIEENELVMLYFYYFDGYNDYANPLMYVSEVPEELGDYFVDIVDKLE